MKRIFITFWALMSLSILLAQTTGISINESGNDPDASAILDVQSTDKGMLIPRMNTSQRVAINNPANGLLVYDTDTDGYWYHDDNQWIALASGEASRIIDADADTYIQVETSPDEDLIRMGVMGHEQVVIDTTGTSVYTDLFIGRDFSASSTRAVEYIPISAIYSFPFSSSPGWQSFKPTTSGKLDFLELRFGQNVDPSYTISLYKGEGTSGILLSTTTISTLTLQDWNAISFPDEVILDKGATYTVGFSSVKTITFVTGDLYPGVTSNVNPNNDFLLRVNVFGEVYTMNIVDDKVGIGTPTPTAALDVNGDTHITGSVGIGTATPTRALLEVDGSVSNQLSSFGFLNATGSTGFNNTPLPGPYSIYASGNIAATGFNAFSDIRIKNIQGISDGNADLSTLMQIEVTDYRMRDSIAKGNAPIKKVIAQQVAEVYPQAVTRDVTEVVPDIYQRAEVQDSWIMLATDLQVGERVKLITEEGNKVYEVSAVEANRFQAKGLTSRLSDFRLRPRSQRFPYG